MIRQREHLAYKLVVIKPLADPTGGGGMAI